QPYLPLDEVSGPRVSLSVETPTYQRLEAALELSQGRVAIFPEGSAGRSREVELDVTLRPTRAVRLFLTGAYERIERARDGSEFARTLIPRVLAEVQPTRAFFLRGIFEYRAERRAALHD